MKYTNKKNIPEAFRRVIINDLYDVKRNDQSIISVSDLISPPIIRQLRIRHWDNLEEDVSDMSARMKGTAIHSLAENIEDPYWIIEKRINLDVNGITLSGKADYYRIDLFQIGDYKTIEIDSFLRNPEGTIGWYSQLNCYAFLWRSLHFKVESLEVNAYLGSWKKYKSSVEGYPQTDMIAVNIPLWTFEQQQEFINERINYHLRFKDVKDEDLPVCTPEERWRSTTIHKLYKNNNVRSSFKTTKKELIESITQEYEQKYPKATFSWKTVEGEDKKCIRCLVKKYCSYWKNNNEG